MDDIQVFKIASNRAKRLVFTFLILQFAGKSIESLKGITPEQEVVNRIIESGLSDRDDLDTLLFSMEGLDSSSLQEVSSIIDKLHFEPSGFALQNITTQDETSALEEIMGTYFKHEVGSEVNPLTVEGIFTEDGTSSVQTYSFYPRFLEHIDSVDFKQVESLTLIIDPYDTPSNAHTVTFYFDPNGELSKTEYGITSYNIEDKDNGNVDIQVLKPNYSHADLQEFNQSLIDSYTLGRPELSLVESKGSVRY